MKKSFYIIICVCLFSGIACGDDCNSLGDKLEKITVIPFKEEAVNDTNYNEVMKQEVKNLPCLAQQIANTKIMQDPRQCFRSSSFCVGDLAFFLFIRKTQLKFKAFLPAEVITQIEIRGMWAYFEHVQEPENRKKLADKCREWCVNNLEQAFAIYKFPPEASP
ncbi:hypothetical protein K8T06_01030 [bacterium]|nr:hypothetical protein [bacterium]